ncbi:amidohydrolase family protein [Chthonomonas sp.]|uniref:amidohydrolase family protein n=1 Tax=Chthonomonas sp. TaxID=2282153 RepID=UPI0039C897E7
MLIIDSHAHVYGDDDSRWPPIANPTRPPDGSGTFARLQSLSRENGVSGICAVQPGTFYGWDNRFICGLARAFPNRVAAICSLDPDDSKSYERFKRYVRSYGVRGLRSYPASDGHLNHPGVLELWRAAEEEGITISVFVRHDQAEELFRMVENHAHQPIVIDHCFITKPDGAWRRSLKSMLRLARFPNTYAKLSFLPLGSVEDYPFRDMHEPCKGIIAAFGADRCVWGSNYPCELWTPKSSYAQNLRLFTHELGLRDAERLAILGQTANRLWFRDKLTHPASL